MTNILVKTCKSVSDSDFKKTFKKNLKIALWNCQEKCSQKTHQIFSETRLCIFRRGSGATEGSRGRKDVINRNYVYTNTFVLQKWEKFK